MRLLAHGVDEASGSKSWILKSELEHRKAVLQWASC